MLTSGDVVDVDLGQPEGHEAGDHRPAVVVSAQRTLDGNPGVLFVVPLTSTQRAYESEVQILPDDRNGLDGISSAQCQHMRSVSERRIVATRGNIGPVTLHQLREVIGLLLDIG